MSAKTTAPFGSWRSPFQAAQIAAGTIRLAEVRCDGESAFWTELRPSEQGRCVVVRRDRDGATRDLVPPPFNVRTRVHEYGGGAFLAHAGEIIFSNFADGRLYRTRPNSFETPIPMTPEADMRYADGVPDPARGRFIYVREDHSETGKEPVNSLVALDASRSDAGKILASGADFYSSPRVSPDGRSLAWLSWNHPDMPWDAAALYIAPIGGDGELGEATCVASGPNESIVQPLWSPDGVLYFLSDRNNWWNLHRLANGVVEPVLEMEAEFARPHWVFGTSTYGFAGAKEIVCAFEREGVWSLGVLDLTDRTMRAIETPYTDIACVRVSGRRAYFVGASAEKMPVVASMDVNGGKLKILKESSAVGFDSAYVSRPEPMAFPGANGGEAHGFFYAPRNPDFAAPAGEKPPLLVMSHGGPTSATAASLNPKIQYYTSRGFAVLDVNYGGSSGYGRRYRESLYGRWGVLDVDDCCAGAKFLAQTGRVDPKRLAITGGSAGGYTTLCCLAFRDVFSAGSSHFGVSDCEALATDTHKFESRYLDKLIGPWPERRDLYRARSPLRHTERFSCPVIFFQGTEDRVVPPNQAQEMADALRRKGLSVALLMFEGEQHGFRRSENVARALDAEFFFFSKIFGFPPADDIEPVAIDNF